MCGHCDRPTPQACICSALPPIPLHLFRSRVIVLQHPSESRRKNSSLPLTSLCLDHGCQEGKNSNSHADFSFYTTIARWWGEEVVDPGIWKLLNDPNELVFVCFPSDDAISFREALTVSRFDLQKVDHIECAPTFKQKVNIIFIDATWKYAKEMVSKTIHNGGWPSHSINVKLEPAQECEQDFKARRFDIRTPPSANHLSTAECIAHVLREVEGQRDDDIFEALLRPLDLMVDARLVVSRDAMSTNFKVDARLSLNGNESRKITEI
eukprot:scaffold3074_cov280-Chaetoceros_neogracile.AAC.24